MYLLRYFRIPTITFKKELSIANFCTNKLEGHTENVVAEKPPGVDPKDRSRKISVETSISYIRSNAYKQAYGEELVWKLYRRNFKGAIPPATRKTCIRKKRISTGSPCPICRDEYLVLHYKNTDLLKQFICPHGGNIISTRKTGICQKQHENLKIAVMQAQDYGLLTFDVPHRSYDYSLYNKQ